MRTALLSALRQTDAGELRAEMMLGGRSVIEWQGQLVQDLGCQRIICLCDTSGPAVLSLQRQVEGQGTEFHAIRGNLQIVNLVRADDELVMVLDGLLADPEAVQGFVGGDKRLEKGIATFPSTHSLVDAWPDDFQRIDRERHWAGLAVMRASHVHKLADLPPDGDAISLILRLGLQAKTECRNIDGSSSDAGRWMLASDCDAIRQRERTLIDGFVDNPAWTGPGRALASELVRQIAPQWLAHGPQASATLAAVLFIVGISFAGMGWAAAGLMAGALGAFAGSVSQSWSDLRARLWSQHPKGRKRLVPSLSAASEVTAALILILALGLDIAFNGEQPLLTMNLPNMALPILALGTARQAALMAPARNAAFWSDRPLHLALFAAAAVWGHLGEVVALFGLGAMAQLMLHRQR